MKYFTLTILIFLAFFIPSLFHLEDIRQQEANADVYIVSITFSGKYTMNENYGDLKSWVQKCIQYTNDVEECDDWFEVPHGTLTREFGNSWTWGGY